MAEPKAKTIQERFGFLDGDLKTAKHDEIMLWLDKNADDIVARLKSFTWEPSIIKEEIIRATAQIDDCRNQLIERINKIRASLEGETSRYDKTDRYELQRFEESLANLNAWKMPNNPSLFVKPKITEKTWEHPITDQSSYRNFIIGFVDMRIIYEITNEPRLTFSLPSLSWGLSRENKEELKQPEWSISDNRGLINFEVKSTIPSLGELIRQINMYRTYCGGAFVVVSPDDRFAEALKSQDILFVKYELF